MNDRHKVYCHDQYEKGKWCHNQSEKDQEKYHCKGKWYLHQWLDDWHQDIELDQ